jgi:hypothetical protein
MHPWKQLATSLLAAVCCTMPAFAQTEEPGDAAPAAESSAAANANNPLADIQAFNLHNYYVPELSELDDNANTFWLRYAQPFGKWLFRASLPVSRVPTGDGASTSGLGDFNAFAAYLFDTGDPAISLGVGPQLTMPTASEDETGTDKWQAGFATVYFNASSKLFQWGGLVTWQTDFAGDDDRPGTNLLALQPFYFLQLGKGLYLRGAPIAVFNLENDTYHVPVGLGIGQVIPTPSVVYNVFIEPQFTILDRGAGQPELQLFVGFNMQFLGG